MSGSDNIRALPLFVSTQANAQILCALLVLVSAVHWIAAGYHLGEVQQLDAIRLGAELQARERIAHTEAGRILGVAQLGTTALVALLFLPWLFHARVNVRALGVRRLQFGREWAYLCFLVPGLNLFRPYQVVSEIWRGSDPSTNDPLAWRQRSMPKLVLAWWITLVAWIALETLAALLIEQASGLSRIRLAHILSLAGNGSAALSASLAYFMVSRLSHAQEAKWRAYGDAAVPVTTLSPSVPT